MHFFLVKVYWAKKAFDEVFGSLAICHYDLPQATTWMAVT
jgi:hypothetical protein